MSQKPRKELVEEAASLAAICKCQDLADRFWQHHRTFGGDCLPPLRGVKPLQEVSISRTWALRCHCICKLLASSLQRRLSQMNIKGRKCMFTRASLTLTSYQTHHIVLSSKVIRCFASPLCMRCTYSNVSVSSCASASLRILLLCQIRIAAHRPVSSFHPLFFLLEA